jgi:Endoribonuclease YbeY
MQDFYWSLWLRCKTCIVLSAVCLYVLCVLQKQLKRDVKAAMQLLGCSKYDVSIWLTTDKTVRKLNAQYRGVDSSTDILSFGMCEVSTHHFCMLSAFRCSRPALMLAVTASN